MKNKVYWDFAVIRQLTRCSGCGTVAYSSGSKMHRRTETFKTHELSSYYCDKCAAEAKLREGAGK
jgi:ribosomal protein L37AE/L43A